MGNGVKGKPKFWQEQLVKWKVSGLFQNQYSRHNNLRQKRIVYWKKKIFSNEPAVTLVEVSI